MNDQQIKKVKCKKEKLIRPFYIVLIIMFISANLFVVLDTNNTNRNTKLVNQEISELNIRQAEVIRKSEELNEQLTEIFNRHR